MHETGDHITCVCPTTGRRRSVLPWAARCFAAQVGVDADLLVVGEGPDSLAGALPRDDRIRYRHVDPMPLGRKYNECVQYAQGPWIALWADDDWHAPHRLRTLLDAALAKPGALLAGARSMLFHRLGTGRTWVYDKPGDPGAPYFLGGMLLFHVEYWRAVRRFDSTARRAADAAFTNGLSRAEYAELAAVLPRDRALGCYVATIHGQNTGRPNLDPSGPGWQPFPEAAVADLMGDAYALWQPGGSICATMTACG